MAELLLIAGVNYPKYEEGSRGWVLRDLESGPWRAYCERLARARARKSSSTKDRITLFDFKLGTRERLVVTHGKADWVVESTTSALRRTNYRWVRRQTSNDDIHTAKLVPLQPQIPTSATARAPSVLYFEGVDELGSRAGDAISVAEYLAAFYEGSSPRRPKASCMSITDVYQYLQLAGEKRSNEIVEVHFFSHAIVDGPILVNTYDFVKHPRLGRRVQRDPLDKDGRTKDFAPENMSAQFAKHLAAALGSTGRIFLWGCNVEPFAKLLLQNTVTPLRAIADSQFARASIRYRWSEEWGPLSNFRDKFRTSATEVSRTPLQVKEVLRAIVREQYGQNLAEKAGVGVIGGLPGTSADYDKPNEELLELLHIPMGPLTQNKENADFRAQLNVYKRLLDARFDVSFGRFHESYGRGYARYPL